MTKGDDEGRAQPRVVEATVGYVRALGGSGGGTRRGWVDCPAGETVPVGQCINCARRESMAVDVHGRVRSLSCRPPEVPTLKRAGEAEPPLSTDVPLVATLMTRDVTCVQPEVSLASALSLMSDGGFRSLPVVAADGRVCGVISSADVVTYLHVWGDGAGRRPPEGARALAERAMHEVDEGPSVSDAMMPLAFTIPESTPLTRAAALMAYEGVHSLIVRNGAQQVIGILSATDALRWLGEVGGYGVTPAG